MILYLDASALVKRYIREPGTVEVANLIAKVEVIGTSIISRAETAAALAKAERLNILSTDDAKQAMQTFRREWPNFIRVQVTEAVVGRADHVAWEYGLRGFDAIHLAAALIWYEQLNEAVVFATFDRQLWQAAQGSNLMPFPQNLPGLLASWKQEKLT